MNPPVRWHLRTAVALLAAFVVFDALADAKLEVVTFNSRALEGNPLHDPAKRSVAVFIPAQATNGARLPMVYYLPGFGNSSERFISSPAAWQKFTQTLADEVAPMLLVVVDGRNRWGGSQYLNSPAQGRYEDYICDEIVAQVEAKHPAPTQGMRRIIAGHSSGGFGALRLAMARTNLFDAVVALSPDSAFNISHLPPAKEPGIAGMKLAEIERLAGPGDAAPKDGELNYHLALSAAYAPRLGSTNGAFEWLYDADGKFRDEVWQRWLANDPLTLVEKNPHAFARRVAVYLEGAAQDQFYANLGARKIFEVVNANLSRCVFYEPPGKHSDRVPERLQRGLAWVFNSPLNDIKPKE
ncbi:MAG: hypothetical protein RLY20_3484 [Verrucomicrobiota bacterium]|jgi:S-formylglutathione hydrolase FrmB